MISMLLVMCILLSACLKKPEKEILKENQFYLLAGDGKKLSVELPIEFVVKEEEKEVSVLKSYYNGCMLDLFELYYFKESEDYGISELQQQLDTYIDEYHELISVAKGKMISETEPKECTAGAMQGALAEVTYSMEDNICYCAEFYLYEGEYVLHGTLRLSGENAGNITIEELIKKLGI